MQLQSNVVSVFNHRGFLCISYYCRSTIYLIPPERTMFPRYNQLFLAVTFLLITDLVGGQVNTVVNNVETSEEGKVKLRCSNGNNPVEGSTFFLNGSDVTTNLSSGQYSLANGEITFTMRQELEGEYTCYAGGNCTVQKCTPFFLIGKNNEST